MSIQEMVARTRLPLLHLAQQVRTLEGAVGNIPTCCPQHMEESFTARQEALTKVVEGGKALQTAVEMVTLLASSEAYCGELEELLLAQQLLRDLRERALKVQRMLEERQRAYLQGLD